MAVGRGSKWRTSTSEALEVIESLDTANAAAAIAHGNVNSKTAIHFCCQMRPDDGAELLAAMLSKCPDPLPLHLVNAATLRGHTPLLYACGRGHDKTVLALLRYGANPKVRTVMGDTALSMAKGSLDPDDPTGQTRRPRLEPTTLAALGTEWCCITSHINPHEA